MATKAGRSNLLPGTAGARGLLLLLPTITWQAEPGGKAGPNAARYPRRGAVGSGRGLGRVGHHTGGVFDHSLF